MKFAATDADAVKAAQAAVFAAEASRQRECGNGEPRQRGTNCRTRETEEAARRETLTVALANRALTDQAAKLDTEAAAIRARLKTAQPVKEGNPLGEALGHLLPISAATAATAQQGLISAIVELLIAATLALPELLRKRPVEAEHDEPEVEQPEPQQAAIVIAERPAPRLVSSSSVEPAVSLISFAAAALERHASSKVEFGDFYLAYHDHARAVGGRPLSPTEAIEPTSKLCEECGIDIRKRGKGRYLVGVRLRARIASRAAVEA